MANRKDSFAANVLPTITPTTKVVAPGEPTFTLTDSALRELITKTSADAVAAAIASLSGTPAPAPVAPAKEPKARKAPVQAPTLVVAPVASGPIDFALKGKQIECNRAAKAAVKAAGLEWNGIKNKKPELGEVSKGGGYGENRGIYWATFWDAYNAKAVELGIPVHTK